MNVNKRSNYIIIKNHEKSEDMPCLKNSRVTNEMLAYLQALDELYYSQLGYYKFYLEEVIDNEVVNHIRLDIGDGFLANLKTFKYLKTKAY